MKISRRTLLKGGIAAAAQFMAGCSVSGLANSQRQPLLGFTAVPFTAGSGAVPAISSDYQYEVLIPWGTPLQPDGPAFQYPPSAAAQAQQVGIGHDGMAFFPLAGNESGMLALNNEYGRNSTVLGKAAPTSLADVRASQHAHGVTVVEIARQDGRWQRVASNNARRFHANSEATFSGPAADSEWLRNKANNTPRGTLSNCSNGQTPWNTYLTCEENFNFYFGAKGDFQATPAQQRYGLQANGRYGWHLFDERFDLANPDYKNESNRFGWVVEVDPFDAKQIPVKRTALGRIKHEGAAHAVSQDGRMVLYMGDDARFEHIYKFVSADNWQAMRARGVSPLDEGVLYVARFDEDGTGEWLPLTMDNPKLKRKFKDQADILVHTRLAASELGATDMDRPEWTTVAPNGDVYCTLTNNHKRTKANAANPQAPNPNGHIIRWRDSNDHLGNKFTWDIFLMADDHFDLEHSFASPDGLWADPDGRLFIMTDGTQRGNLNNQLLVADTGTGEVRRLLTGVSGCEVTGITVTPDRKTLFVNLQHPGNGDPKLTNFPAAPDQVTIPRDATLAISRKDGGIVGS
ncbi:MAG: PhoX family protein [Pseudomonadales bacterium]